MSIYSTTWRTDSTEHDEDCDVWVPVADGEEWDMAGDGRYWRRDLSRPCSCHCGPIVYQGSHVLPFDDDERAGSVDVAFIPGFIGRTDRPALHGDEDDGPVWPWLRLSANDDKEGSVAVLLDRKQVMELRDTLNQFAEYMPEPKEVPRA